MNKEKYNHSISVKDNTFKRFDNDLIQQRKKTGDKVTNDKGLNNIMDRAKVKKC